MTARLDDGHGFHPRSIPDPPEGWRYKLVMASIDLHGTRRVRLEFEITPDPDTPRDWIRVLKEHYASWFGDAS